MTLHQLAEEAASTYLAAVDEEVPGLVLGFYVVGSAALDDFRPGVSDLDFVAVTAEEIAPDVALRLERMHWTRAEERAAPSLDGIYAAREQVRLGPLTCPEGPHVEQGLFRPSGRYGRHVTDYHALARYRVPLRSLPEGRLDVWLDHREVAFDVIRSLEDRWQPWYASARRGDVMLAPEAVSSCVLEIARLHYTLVCGDMVSKTNAGLYALIAFSARWRCIVEEALTIRKGLLGISGYANNGSMWRDALAFAGMVMDDIRELAPDLAGRSGPSRRSRS